MNKTRKHKLLLILFVMSVLMLFTLLLMYALRQNISVFYSPTQVVQGEASGKASIRLGGMVVQKSVHRDPTNLQVSFKLTDFNKTITVNYKGILPDLFREGQGIVALGHMIDNYNFQALEVLAKHDENYMPPEVKDALSKSKKGAS